MAVTDPLDALPVVTDYADIPYDGVREIDGGWVDDEDADADNSVLADMPANALPTMLSAVADSPVLRLAQVKAVGPLRRELRPQKVPMRGLDVAAVHRALARAGTARWKKGGGFSWVAGPFFFRSLRTFQQRQGLRPDGVYGTATHRSLGKWFDAYGIKQYQDAKVGLTGAELKRQRFRSHCLFLYHNRHLVRYTMSGWRMTIIRHGLKPDDVFEDGKIWEDCSSIGKGLCKWIDIPDPNGFGYTNAWGFTGTSSVRGSYVPARQASLKIADHIYTGRSPYSHMWYYIGSGNGFSHGKDSDPRIVPFDYRPIATVRRFLESDA